MKKSVSKLLFAAVICLFALTPGIAESQTAPMYRNQVAVLIYHHIHAAAKSGVTITPALFRLQLQFLLDNDYTFISLETMTRFLAGEPVPPNAVLVTFDDGYQSFYTNAYPILQELNIPAVNFTITHDLEAPMSSRVPSLSREEIKKMGESGLIDSQCHSHQLHRKVNQVPLMLNQTKADGKPESPEEQSLRIKQDTAACIRELDAVDGHVHDAYAYPYGMFDTVGMRSIRQSGIRYAFTTLSETATSHVDPLQIPRINAGSPYLNPLKLHQIILSKTVQEVPSGHWVPLSRVVRQLGGSVVQEENRDLRITFPHCRYTLASGSVSAQSENGTVELQEHLQLRHGKNYIRLTDLEALFGQHLVFNPNQRVYQPLKSPVLH